MSAPGGILTLDLSLRTGWAYGSRELRAPLCGVYELPNSSQGLGRIYAAMRNTVLDLIEVHEPRLVVMEAPLVRQDDSARMLLGLAAVAELACYDKEVRCREAHVSSVRKAVLGRGTFPKGQAKPAVMEFCAQHGFRVRDHNAGDACVLWVHASGWMPPRELRAA